MKHQMTKATEISKETKKRVWDRDGHRCIICNISVPVEAACCHVVRRSKGGLGVPQNIVTMCQYHHYLMDNGGCEEPLQKVCRDYLKGWYPDWTEESVTYDKYGWIK